MPDPSPNKPALRRIVGGEPSLKPTVDRCFPDALTPLPLEGRCAVTSPEADCPLVQLRASGCYEGLALWLNAENHTWHLVTDDEGQQCLVAYPKEPLS